MEPPLPAAVPSGGEDVVFIADDEDLIEDEWQAESTADVQLHTGQIQLQLRLCFAAALALPVLGVMIALAWRRYGAKIYRSMIDEAAAKKDT